MKLFITGATGYIGHAVAKQFKSRGYDVTGLVRSKENALTLEKAGIVPFIGNLEDPESFKTAISSFDIFIHAGFIFDPAKGLEYTIKVEKAIVETVVKQWDTTNKIVVYTSGTGVLGETGQSPADESFTGNPVSFTAWRPAVERTILQAVGLKGIVIRPGMVYGHGGSPVIKAMVQSAKAAGNTDYIGNGLNKWSVVYLDDLAELYVKAVERATAGEIYHGVSDEAVSMKTLALLINQLLGIPTVPLSITLEEALKKFPFAELLAANIIASNRKAKEKLGWRPVHRSIEEVLPSGEA